MTETFPILSNLSSHGPRRYVKHRIGSFAYECSTTIFARQNNSQLRSLATLHTAVHSVKFTMSYSNGENVNDRCRVCAFVFVNKKRKRIIDGEFLKKFEKVYHQNVREDDGFPRAVCDTCHYRVETMWKKASVVIPGHHLSKRRHPLSPLTSSQVDEQTASQISKKKGYRIPFENVPIRPKSPALVMSSKEADIWNEKGTQTRKSGCHCFPVSSKGSTCVKVCTVAECITKQDTCTCTCTCRNYP